MTPPAHMLFIVDFDGTIAPSDTVDALLERFAAPEWREIEEEWVAGRINSRQCMASQLALVTAERARVEHFLQSVVDDGAHHQLFDLLIVEAHDWLRDNRETLTEVVGPRLISVTTSNGPPSPVSWAWTSALVGTAPPPRSRLRSRLLTTGYCWAGPDPAAVACRGTCARRRAPRGHPGPVHRVT